DDAARGHLRRREAAVGVARPRVHRPDARCAREELATARDRRIAVAVGANGGRQLRVRRALSGLRKPREQRHRLQRLGKRGVQVQETRRQAAAESRGEAEAPRLGERRIGVR
ncbi:MAG: hypothetical protein ACK56F_00775, partial [bacterium]